MNQPNPFATREAELYSNWEMLGPLASLLAVSVLGLILGHGLDILFRR